MIVNRRTFNVKPGCMEEVIELIVENIRQREKSRPANVGQRRLLTAVFGPFDVLVMETENENMEQYQQYCADILKDPSMEAYFARWSQLIVGGGSNEIWEVVTL